MAELQNQARYHINKHIFENGVGPSVEYLALTIGEPTSKIEEALTLLAENHALVLHPNSFDVWVAHPFALFPTLFWVKSNGKQWWGNCPWCSFGIAALCHANTEIFTKLNGEEESLKIDIVDNQVVQTDYVVHFPIPASKFWENVIYTCSMMLIFKNEEDVNEWCKRHNKPKGQVLPITQVWELAKIWYGNYLDPNFERKTKEIAESMFSQVGLTANFWKL